MKHFVCLCSFAILLSTAGYGQSEGVALAGRSPIMYTPYSAYPAPQESVGLPQFNLTDPVNASPPGKRMATTGKVLAFVGTGLFIAGIVTIANTVDNQQQVNGQYVDDGDGAIVAGVGMYIGGFAMVATGIPLWAVGTVRYNKYKAKQKIVFNMKGAGGALSYRF